MFIFGCSVADNVIHTLNEVGGAGTEGIGIVDGAVGGNLLCGSCRCLMSLQQHASLFLHHYWLHVNLYRIALLVQSMRNGKHPSHLCHAAAFPNAPWCMS